MMFPLVLDLAADRVPIAVTCRVLGFSKQAFFRWRANPVSQRDWDNAHLTNAAVDLHRDDPAFGYRFISDEIEAEAGLAASERRVWRLCSEQRLWSVFSKKRGLNRKAGPPVHDDLVLRDFTATRPDQLWLTDITEHWTDEGKLYLCAIKDGRFQGANATPSLGGYCGGFLGPTAYRVLDATRRLFSTNHSETFQREYRCGCRLGQACRHDHSNGRSGRHRTSGRLGHPKGSAISVVSTTHT